MTYPMTRRHLTVEQFQQMIAHGILTKDDRLELLKGEIVEMSPINPSHAGAVNRINRLFVQLVDDRAIVAIQNPIQLDRESQPQPDLCLLRPRDDFYATAHALPQEVLLVIEVAETSIRLDRSIKRPLYARAEIGELWIIDLAAKTIEICTEPLDGQYQTVRQVRAGATITPQALPDVTVKVEALLG